MNRGNDDSLALGRFVYYYYYYYYYYASSSMNASISPMVNHSFSKAMRTASPLELAPSYGHECGTPSVHENKVHAHEGHRDHSRVYRNYCIIFVSLAIT